MIAKLPEAKQLGMLLDFSAKAQNSFIHHGGKSCELTLSPKGHAVAYFAKDGMKLLQTLLIMQFIVSFWAHFSNIRRMRTRSYAK